MVPGPALADHVGAEDGGEPAFDVVLRSHAALPPAAPAIIGDSNRSKTDKPSNLESW